jgi:hypothetical protein
MKTQIILLGIAMLLNSCQKRDYDCTCTTTTITYSNQPNLSTAYAFDSTFTTIITKEETNELIHATKRKAKKSCGSKGGGSYLSPRQCNIK